MAPQCLTMSLSGEAGILGAGQGRRGGLKGNWEWPRRAARAGRVEETCHGDRQEEKDERAADECQILNMSVGRQRRSRVEGSRDDESDGGV